MSLPRRSRAGGDLARPEGVHGEDDEVVPIGPDRRSAQRLAELGYPHVFLPIARGRHQLPFLARQGSEYARFWKWLEERRRDPAPRRMLHVALEADHGAGDWVEVLETTGEVARVEARVAGRGRLVIESEGARRLRVHLVEGLVDPGKPVEISLGKRRVHSGRVEPTIESVLASWFAGRGDRKRITAYSVVVEP